jgi:hypothetical protein
MAHDLFALLRSDTSTPAADPGLRTISLWPAAVHYLCFFTLVPDRFASHYDKPGRFRYFCLGDGCPACDAGDRATTHIYLPVWDAQHRRVAVLRFDDRPDGPVGKILAFLEAYRDRLAEVVAVFTCRGAGEFSIAAHEPRPETDRGVAACKEFCLALESGAIDLRDCVRRLDAAAIAALPSVRAMEPPPVGPPVASWRPTAHAGNPVDPVSEVPESPEAQA